MNVDSATAEPPARAPAGDERIFLCVVDATEECRNAIYFAARRSMRTRGRVGLLYVMAPAEFQHWMSVEEKMREEAREEAETFLQEHAALVQEKTGRTAALYVREGEPAEAVRALIEEDSRICILVLGAGVGKKGPGPLVSSIGGRQSGRFPIPITIVPGNLTEEQIDLLT